MTLWKGLDPVLFKNVAAASIVRSANLSPRIFCLGTMQRSTHSPRSELCCYHQGSLASSCGRRLSAQPRATLRCTVGDSWQSLLHPSELSRTVGRTVAVGTDLIIRLN